MKIGTKIVYLTFLVFLMMSLNTGMTGQQVKPQPGSPPTPPPPKPPCDCHYQGCTPGYWKNHLDMWVGYSPSDPLLSVFTDSLGPGLTLVDLNGDGVEDTLLDALRYHGGSGVEGAARILLRAGVAALLNVAHSGVDYYGCWQGFVVEADVINAVLEKLDTMNRGSILYLAKKLDDFNNSYCPLN